MAADYIRRLFFVRPAGRTNLCANQGKFVLEKIVGWADGFIVCPRGLASAWAQKRAHPTSVEFKHNFVENKLALVCQQVIIWNF
ncbi:MAG: hypothetical protein A2Z94_07150 [Gallionellales bacterium GWA2_55_18]|nr:MAG: hypothetical protein A2Z94_07150 [Gallionellales bacterium GWA2_55_18]